MSSIDVFAGLVETQRMAFAIADAAVISDIETEGVATEHSGCQWLDVRSMTSLLEHAPEVVDMSRQALQYAAHRGLIFCHPIHQHLVRITRRSGCCAQG